MAHLTSHKRRVRAAFLTIVLILLGLACWVLFIEPNRLVVHQQRIALQNWPSAMKDLKVAAISDIHAGSPFIDLNKLDLIVAKTNETNPDLIVLLGDFVIRDRFYKHPIEPEAIAGSLRQLRAPLGVYAVLGNHDWWFDGQRVRHALEGNGIKVLENEVAQTAKDGETFWLVGLADAWTRPQSIQKTLDLVPPKAAMIVLTHNPDIFPGLPASVPLTLAGHTHGGQVNFPVVGRLVVPSNYGQKYAAGHVQEGSKHLFVTTGIGTSILPVRFRVPPEIALLAIGPQ